MSKRRVGLWMIGACGGVGGTTAIGLAAIARGLAKPTGLVTARPCFAQVPFDEPAAFVLGGHDIRQGSFAAAVGELHSRSNVIPDQLLLICREQLDEWSQNIRPGIAYRLNPTIASLADRNDLYRAATPSTVIERFQRDVNEFQTDNNLDQVVVINAASTEPPFELGEDHQTLATLRAVLDRPTPPTLPPSGLYAYAALEAGFPYVNLTPSLGASFPAAEELARQRRVPIAGQDLKTGETLLKSALAPVFAHRNLQVLSWVGHNILGNRDGQVLADPSNKASKVKTKDALLAELLGYRPQSLVSIEYIESLDDWKTAWDHVHFEGFLGTKMSLQFTWQGCDSVLAAPLVIDLARVVLLAQRRGESGILPALAPFFKSPGGTAEHDFAKQSEMLEQYLTGRSD
jgi:myo-inositol-1-phosphate synthase